MHLNNLKIGQKATISSISGGDPAYRQRLIAMGLIPGAVIEMLRIAPLGDPVEIRVRGVSVSLRKDEAAALELEITT